ncbi:uncharacterized protein METZ01_LOCUS344957, partial [marine metagenome]
LSDEVDHFPHSVIGGGGFLYDPFNRGEIGDADFTAQGKGQQVAGQGTSEASFFSEDGVLELDYVAEVVFPKKDALHVHLAPVFILVAPLPHRIVVLQGEPQGVELGVTTSAGGIFSMDL